jgi:hypothetical protein
MFSSNDRCTVACLHTRYLILGLHVTLLRPQGCWLTAIFFFRSVHAKLPSVAGAPTAPSLKLRIASSSVFWVEPAPPQCPVTVYCTPMQNSTAHLVHSRLVNCPRVSLDVPLLSRHGCCLSLCPVIPLSGVLPAPL